MDLENKYKKIKYENKFVIEYIPESLEKEDLRISPIENMILDFENTNTNIFNIKKVHNIILPYKGNIFPYIEPSVFNRIKLQNKNIKIDKNRLKID